MKKKALFNKKVFSLTVAVFLLCATVFVYLHTSLFTKQPNESEITSDKENIPDYSDEPIIILNGNIPYFDSDELEDAKQSYEYYGELDRLGRCTYAISSVSQETMPKGQREELKIKPTGWKQAKYEGIIEDDFLYNRCHLIAYCLTSENNNKKNLITGTHYMNENMNYYEVLVASYLDDHSDSHVLYRATPVFEGDNLLAKGILLEAQTIEDDEISFCVFAYNVQPGIILDYSDGSSQIEKSAN